MIESHRTAADHDEGRASIDPGRPKARLAQDENTIPENVSADGKCTQNNKSEKSPKQQH
jgi:hypothetical protein